MKNLFNVALKKKTTLNIQSHTGVGGPGGGRKSHPCTQGAEIWPVKKSGEFNPWRLRARLWLRNHRISLQRTSRPINSHEREAVGPGPSTMHLGQLQGPF